MTITFHIKYNNKIKKFKFVMSLIKYQEILSEFENDFKLLTVGPITFPKEQLLFIEVLK